MRRLTPEQAADWYRRDAWTMHQFTMMCLGGDPDSYKASAEALVDGTAEREELTIYNTVQERMRFAVAANTTNPARGFPVLADWAVRSQPGDRIWDQQLPFVSPQEPAVLAWAAKHHPDAFPFADRVANVGEALDVSGLPPALRQKLAFLVACLPEVMNEPLQKNVWPVLHKQLRCTQRSAIGLAGWLLPKR